MDIGETIRRRREEIDMTQEQLAVAVGYKHKSSVNKIEVGKTNVPTKKVQVFAKALGIPPEFLFYGSEGKKATIEMNSLSKANQKKMLSYYNYLLEQQRKGK